MERVAGVLCPISALPSKWGIGDFGPRSYEFADLLKKGGYKLWQVLPLNPLGYGHSPYQPFSSFAIDELYVDLNELKELKLLDEAPAFKEGADKVYYEEIRDFKNPLLQKAYKKDKSSKKEIEAFVLSHPWVKDWALFMMNKRKENLQSWSFWDQRRKDMIKGTIELTAEEKDGVNYEIWLQMVLYRQWKKLRAYVNSLGIKIIGDVPFYVGHDSADVWGNQEYFLLNRETLEPDWIAGVPPDYFSATGQRWGNPMYDWDLLEKRDFDFIINRLKGNGELYDIIRLDHFRAFDTYWKIPASCPTAMEGSWIEAPGYKFFETFLKAAPEIEIVAEDLGDLRPEVLTLRDHFNFPGMNVVQFTFYDMEVQKTDHRDRETMVAYLGTHDNQMALSYFNDLPDYQKSQWLEALSNLGFEGSLTEQLINYELSLKAAYAIFSMQDILELDDAARFNVPGVIDDVNWTWRMKDYGEFEKRLAHLRELNLKYNR